jgi:hypothetical protein
VEKYITPSLEDIFFLDKKNEVKFTRRPQEKPLYLDKCYTTDAKGNMKFKKDQTFDVCMVITSTAWARFSDYLEGVDEVSMTPGYDQHVGIHDLSSTKSRAACNRSSTSFVSVLCLLASVVPDLYFPRMKYMTLTPIDLKLVSCPKLY